MQSNLKKLKILLKKVKETPDNIIEKSINRLAKKIKREKETRNNGEKRE